VKLDVPMFIRALKNVNPEAVKGKNPNFR